MKPHRSLVALAFAVSFAVGAPASRAEEKKSLGDRLGETLRKADEAVNGPSRAEQERRRVEEERRRDEERRRIRAEEAERRSRKEAIYFKGRITSVDPRSRQFRAVGNLAGVFTVTEGTRITKEGAGARLSDLERGDEVTGTARRTSEDTFLAITVKATASEYRRPGERFDDPRSDRRFDKR